MRESIEHEPTVKDLVLSAMWLACTGLGIAVVVLVASRFGLTGA